MSPSLNRHIKYFLFFFGLPTAYCLFAAVAFTAAAEALDLSTRRIIAVWLLAGVFPVSLSWASLTLSYRKRWTLRFILNGAFTALAIAFAAVTAIASHGNYPFIPLSLTFITIGWIWIALMFRAAKFLRFDFVGEIT